MHLLDYYVATVGIVLLALCEVFSVGILYGAGRLGRNIREMTAHSPSPILMICWAGVAPAIILVTTFLISQFPVSISIIYFFENYNLGCLDI